MIEAAPPADSNRSGSHRRELQLAVVGCLVAAGALLTASGLDWLQASVAIEPPLPDARETFTGAEIIDALVGIGVLSGAAGLALIATRWPGRLAVGIVLTVVGLLTLVQIGFFLYDGGMQTAWNWAQAYAADGSSVFPDHEVSPTPAVVAILGAGIAVAVGVFATVSGRRWPLMGARYERRSRSAEGYRSPASSSENSPASADLSPESREAAMWSALERGEDPTATEPDSRTGQAFEPPDQPVSGR